MQTSQPLRHKKSFNCRQRESDASIDDFLINYKHHVMKLKDHKKLLPESVLSYRTLKNAKLTSKNERLVKATIEELTLFAMARQL